jgi:hypothetical protein
LSAAFVVDETDRQIKIQKQSKAADKSVRPT